MRGKQHKQELEERENDRMDNEIEIVGISDYKPRKIHTLVSSIENDRLIAHLGNACGLKEIISMYGLVSCQRCTDAFFLFFSASL